MQMFVSILQLMGFSLEKPVHSRASENSESGRAQAHIEGITAEAASRAPSKCGTAVQAHAQANSARRTDVKAKVGKTAVSAKLPVKVRSKPAQPVAVRQPVKKAVVKPSGTGAENSAARPGPEPSLKSHARSKAAVTSRSGTKVNTQTVAKSVAKPPVKAVKPGASKAPSKPAVTLKNQKSAPKVAAKKVNQVLQKSPKPPSKSGVKPVVAKELKITAPKALAAPAPKGKTDAKSHAIAGQVVNLNTAKPVTKTAVPVPTSAAGSSQAASAAPVPAKAGRPSSRLAQLTVPSMAQSVASTAAKSSFTQSTALPLIAPPLPSASKKDPKLANNWKTKPVEQLSDAELLSMPDAEYMNDKQMAVFRLKLSVLKQDILNSASDTTEHLREDTVVVPDPADRATIEEEHALELRTRDRERKLLKKIEQSINRIDAGDYGYCDETGEPIGVGRLLARPTATLSLEAQQRRELKQKMFGD